MLQTETDQNVAPVDVTQPAPAYVPYHEVAIDKTAAYRYRNDLPKDTYDSPPDVQVAHPQRLYQDPNPFVGEPDKNKPYRGRNTYGTMNDIYDTYDA